MVNPDSQYRDSAAHTSRRIRSSISPVGLMVCDDMNERSDVQQVRDNTGAVSAESYLGRDSVDSGRTPPRQELCSHMRYTLGRWSLPALSRISVSPAAASDRPLLVRLP